MTMSSSQVSRDLARLLGEKYNRSVSRRLADGMFGPYSGNGGVDAMHLLMTTATATVVAAPEQFRDFVAILWGLGFLNAWICGERPSIATTALGQRPAKSLRHRRPVLHRRPRRNSRSQYGFVTSFGVSPM